MKNLLMAVVLLGVAGCTSTNMRVQHEYVHSDQDRFAYDIVTAVSVTDIGLSIFTLRLDQSLKQLDIDASEGATKTARITFIRYYVRHGATRVFAGIAAGVDKIVTNVEIIDNQTGQAVSKFVVSSTNPSAIWTAKGLIQQHADKIANYLKSGAT